MHLEINEMDVPPQLREYWCDEYFRDGWFERGRIGQRSQTWVVIPYDQAYEDTEAGFLAIGRSGEGVDFEYRKGIEGLWAYYPIECRFKLMAETVAELAEGWCANQLTV